MKAFRESERARSILIVTSTEERARLVTDWVQPLLMQLPLALRTLLLTAVMVPAMTYLIMPGMARVFRRWLYPRASGAADAAKRLARDPGARAMQRGQERVRAPGRREVCISSCC